MVKHIVMFKFDGNDESRLATAESFRSDLEKLPSIIEELKSIEVGINVNPAEQYDLVLTAVADTMDDVKIYSAHPAHVSAVAAVKAKIVERCCVDYNC